MNFNNAKYVIIWADSTVCVFEDEWEYNKYIKQVDWNDEELQKIPYNEYKIDSVHNKIIRIK